MRLDKFLKVSRIIKRRTVANEVAQAGRVTVNGRTAKPGTTVKVGDVLTIRVGQGPSHLRLLAFRDNVSKEEEGDLYALIDEEP